MKNIAELIAAQAEQQNPGQHIGRFLLEHSNSLEYLVSQLEAYLEAARADLESERAVFRKLMRREPNPPNFRADGRLEVD